MAKVLDYQNPNSRSGLRLLVAIAALVALAIGMIILPASPRDKFPGGAAVANLDRYVKQSEHLIADTRLTNAEKATQLTNVITTARNCGVLPFRLPRPSAGEIELAVLLSRDEVRRAAAPERADAFMSYVQKSYPSFNLDMELRRRDHERRKKGTTHGAPEERSAPANEFGKATVSRTP